MKVLHIMANFSVGGSTETVLSLAQGLTDKGYEVVVYSGKNTAHEGSMLDFISSVPYKILFNEHLIRDIEPLTDLRALMEIYSFLKKGKYDIIHCHTSKAGVLGRIAGRLAGVPVVIFTYHGLPFHQFQSKTTNLLYRSIEKFAGLFSHCVTCVSSVIRERIIKYGIATPEKSLVIRSAFDLSAFKRNDEKRKEIRSAFGIKDNDVVFGKIGRFAELKGHRFILDAVEKIITRHKNIKVIFMGNGALEDEMKLRVKEKGLTDYIIFAGLIDPNEIPGYMNAMDVLVHSSLLEGLARIFPQSIELEKPIVTFDLDGAPEVIKDGVNGFLTPAGDTEILADKMCYFIEHPEKIAEMGKAGKLLIGNEFDERKMIDETDELYRRLFAEFKRNKK